MRATKLEKLKHGEISSESDAVSDLEDGGAKGKPKKKAATGRKKKEASALGSSSGASDAEAGAKKVSKSRAKAATSAGRKKSAASQSDSDTAAVPEKRGRPPKSATSTVTTSRSAKGKARALSPVSDFSSYDGDGLEGRELFLNEAELANSDAMSDNSDIPEASDEERELAYAAAADGSLEMQRGDISPTSSSATAKSTKDRVEVQSPAKRRKKGYPLDSPTSPEKKVKTAPVFVEISDSE